MKIEIDLNDILGDDYGSESLQESVKRQVIDKVANIVTEGVAKKIDQKVTEVINAELAHAIQIQLPKIVDNLMEAEYTPVDTYGSKKTPTTFRNELVRNIQENMVYKKPASSYSSDTNIFTKAVDAVIAEQMKVFQKDFLAKINENFVQQTMAYALDTLRAKLKIEAPKT